MAYNVAKLAGNCTYDPIWCGLHYVAEILVIATLFCLLLALTSLQWGRSVLRSDGSRWGWWCFNYWLMMINKSDLLIIKKNLPFFHCDDCQQWKCPNGNNIMMSQRTGRSEGAAYITVTFLLFISVVHSIFLQSHFFSHNDYDKHTVTVDGEVERQLGFTQIIAMLTHTHTHTHLIRLD